MDDRQIDQLLVDRAGRGEVKAFELLVVKYRRRLMRLLSRFIRDECEAEDVAQETFIKAYRALPGFRGESAFYTWLYRIAINTAKNRLASSGRRIMLSAGFADNDESPDPCELMPDRQTPEEHLMSRETARLIDEAVDELSEELRRAITLREIEGLSYEEIAGVMDTPIGTVRSRIFRAREAIAKKLRSSADEA